MTRLLKDSIFEVKSSQLSKRNQLKNMKAKLTLYFVFMISIPVLSLGFTIGWAIPIFITIFLGVFFWFGVENHYRKRYPANTPVLQITKEGMYFPLLGGVRETIEWSKLESIKFQNFKSLPVLELVLRDASEPALSNQPSIFSRKGKFYRLHLNMYETEIQKNIIDAVKSAAMTYQPDIVIL